MIANSVNMGEFFTAPVNHDFRIIADRSWLQTIFILSSRYLALLMRTLSSLKRWVLCDG